MDISLQIIRINIYTDNAGIFRKFVHFGPDLSGTHGNPETQDQITFRVGDHISVTMSVSTSDTSEIQRMVIGQYRLRQHTCDNRYLSFPGKTKQCLLTFCAVHPMSKHDHRAYRLLQCLQDHICRCFCLCRICMTFFEFHIIDRISHFTSLHIHGQVDQNRSLSSCIRNMICLI